MKLRINNDDASVTLPLAPVEGDTNRTIILPEPNMDQLTAMTGIVAAADEKVGPIPQLNDEPTQTEVREANEQLRQRQRVTYGPDRPYGRALIEIVEMLTGEHYEGSDFYGWAMNPLTCNQLLTHFQNPLPGPE